MMTGKSSRTPRTAISLAARWAIKTCLGGAVSLLGAGIATIVLQALTGLPLRVLASVPLAVWTAIAALLITAPTTLAVVRRRSSAGYMINRRHQPSRWSDSWAVEASARNVRWRIHAPLRGVVIFSRALSHEEIGSLEVELPPRCGIADCGAELDERRSGVLRHDYVWRCLVHGEQARSSRPWAVVADDVRRLTRAELERNVPMLHPGEF